MKPHLSTGHLEAATKRLARDAARWPAALAMLTIALFYALISDHLTIGPRGWLLVVVAVLLVPLNVFRFRGYHKLTRGLALGMIGLVTLAVLSGAIFLVTRLSNVGKNVAPYTLLQDGALLWLSNVLVFALWYWEVDNGGPVWRAMHHYHCIDFVFPQMTLGEEHEQWTPEFLDYLFLAFNTSTAFSPTDTMVLSKRVKALMMTQSLVSLVVISALVARAINIL